MIKKISSLALILLVLFTIQAQSQCKIQNNYFQAGEELTYDLYFKWGLVNTKAGISTLKTSSLKYDGKDAYKMSLVARSTGMAKKMFSLNDTLSTFTTKDLTPLAFKKDAKEGDEHTLENMTYTYNANGSVTVHTKRTKNGEFRFDEKINFNTCVHDLVSVVFYARTLDYQNMKKGDEVKVDFITGKRKAYMIIEHQGTEKVKANDDKTYNCIKLVLSVIEGNKSAFEDREEAMKVYITNDNNRMPVRLDSKLKIGSTRAMLKTYKGNRHPVKTE